MLLNTLRRPLTVTSVCGSLHHFRPSRISFEYFQKQRQKKQRQKPEMRYPVDTGRKLNVHKTFRSRPGRLLNVLCTFNLSLEFTG